jgi:ribosomal protein S12 methylthiotransferase
MKYYLLTLGCPKNTVDSEGMATLLTDAGYRGTAAPEDADILIVNTCGFLAAAEEESLANLRELAKGKRRGQVLIAAGCMAQRAGERIVKEVPGVDGLLGTRRWMEIVPFVAGLRGGAGQRVFGRYALLGDPEHALADATPRPPGVNGSAYLKISDGCNAPCAFCSIPTFKGKLHSRPVEGVVTEARALVAEGAQEIILIAQDTTDYGRDVGQPDALPGLMAAVLKGAPELRWLRLMYAYPGHISERLIETMASDPRICHYLDIPLQHGHRDTLRRMFRPSNTDRLLATFAAMRGAMPDMAFRSTFIVGFPGETEQEFQGLLDFIEALQFDKVGVFTFSPEPGTPAADMPGQVAEEVKAERYGRVMALQQRISLARNQAQVGKALDVLVESQGEMEAAAELPLAGLPLFGGPAVTLRDDGVYDGVYKDGRRSQKRPRKQVVSLGRSYRDAPEVDGLVVVPGVLPAGQMARVRITGAMEYDLVGEVIPER